MSSSRAKVLISHVVFRIQHPYLSLFCSICLCLNRKSPSASASVSGAVRDNTAYKSVSLMNEMGRNTLTNEHKLRTHVIDSFASCVVFWKISYSWRYCPFLWSLIDQMVCTPYVSFRNIRSAWTTHKKMYQHFLFTSHLFS